MKGIEYTGVDTEADSVTYRPMDAQKLTMEL